MESRIDKGKIADACNKSYSELGHNAYFANGFQAGVEFAEEELEDERRELTDVLTKIVGISDRKHDAWDKAKELIKKHKDGISR